MKKLETNAEAREGLPVAHEVIAEAVLAATERVKTRLASMGQDAVAIGMDLQTIKDGLPHGEWLPWLDANFGMSDRMAQNFMQVAKMALENPKPISDLSTTVQMLLAVPNMEPEVREQVVDGIVEGGIKKTSREVQKAIKEATKKLTAERDSAKQEAKDAKSKQKATEKAAKEQLEKFAGEKAQLILRAREQVEALEQKLQQTQSDPESEARKALVAQLNKDLKKERDALKQANSELQELKHRIENKVDTEGMLARWKGAALTFHTQLDAMLGQCPTFLEAQIFDERAVGLLDGVTTKLERVLDAYRSVQSKGVVDQTTAAIVDATQ